MKYDNIAISLQLHIGIVEHYDYNLSTLSYSLTRYNRNIPGSIVKITYLYHMIWLRCKIQRIVLLFMNCFIFCITISSPVEQIVVHYCRAITLLVWRTIVIIFMHLCAGTAWETIKNDVCRCVWIKRVIREMWRWNVSSLSSPFHSRYCCCSRKVWPKSKGKIFTKFHLHGIYWDCVLDVLLRS